MSTSKNAAGATVVTGGQSAILVTGQNALSAAAEIVLGAKSDRIYAEVKNLDAAILVYLGPDVGVTPANGHLLRPGEAFGFEGYTGPIFAVAASGAPIVSFIQW